MAPDPADPDPAQDPAPTRGDPPADRLEAALVVFDLDGTLVELRVDWEGFREQLSVFLDEDDLPAGPERTATWTLARLRERGDPEAAGRVLEVLRQAELAGAVASVPVEAGMDVLRRVQDGRPLALVTNNTRPAAQEALRRHGIRPMFGMLVALEDVDRHKPHADGLRLVLDAHGDVDPGDVLFVGDGKKDAEAADRAGVRFLDVDDWQGG